MPLREHDPGIELVDHAVVVLVADVVGLLVGNLAVTGGEVPEQSVVDRARRDRAVGGVAAAQQHQLFVQQCGELVLEIEYARRQRELAAIGGDTNRRILGIGEGLVAQQRVKIDQARGDQQDGIVGRPEIDRRRAIDRQLQRPPHDRGVGLDQAQRIEVVRIIVECDRTLEALAELDQHAGVVVGRGLSEVLDPRLERIEPVEHALDPAFGELRQWLQRRTPGAAGPQTPLDLVLATGQTAVAGQVPVVRQGLDIGTLDRNLDRTLGIVDRELDPAIELAGFRLRRQRRR